MSEQVLAVAVGVLLGALVSVVGYFLKFNFERRRVLNKVLFGLMELWYTVGFINAFDEKDVADRVIEVLKRKVPGDPPSAEQERNVRTMIETQARKQLHSMQAHLLTSPEQTLHDWYGGAIRELATVAPLLAFRLSGRESVQPLLAKADELLGTGSSPESSSEDAITTDVVMGVVSRRLTAMVRGSLEKDLPLLALRVGPVTYLRVARIVRATNSSESSKREEMNQMMIDAIEEMIEAHQNRADEALDQVDPAQRNPSDCSAFNTPHSEESRPTSACT